MLESLKKNETFEYQKLTPEEMSKKGILGRLVGPCADFINPTRNGRKYPEDLWEKLFADPLMQEKIKNGVCLGELGHPTDRTETDLSKVAISLRELPKKNSKGQLYAYFDILDTPNGRILKTLCDYGSIVGVSSRGTGDVIQDDNGEDIVDPNTYQCECWDVVLVPAVETARMEYVTESLSNKPNSLNKALMESLENANEDERRVMEETLQTLNISVGDKPTLEVTSTVSDSNLVTSGNIFVTSEQTNTSVGWVSSEASHGGSEDLLKGLQEALKANVTLETQVKSLQEQLAVNDIKVGKLNEELGKHKDALKRLSSVVSEKKKLQEDLEDLKGQLEKKQEAIDAQKQRISKLVEATKTNSTSSQKLNEAVSVKDSEITRLNESLIKQKEDYEVKVAKLLESNKSLKADSEAKEKELSKKLERTEKLKEGYKKLASDTMANYIESKATLLGITASKIKNQLPESYTTKEVDKVCEELQSYELNISKLPFSVDRKVKVKVHESRNDNLQVGNDSDDTVDETLLSIAGLKR